MKIINSYILSSVLLLVVLTGLLTGCLGQQASKPPTISEPKISAPTPQEPGKEVGISIDVSNVSGTKLTYAWQVDGGEIVRGDGSPAITYRTPDEPGIYNVRVTVNWDDSSVEKVTTIRVEASGSAVAESEPPTDTPAPDSGDAGAEPEPIDTPEPPTDTPTPVPTNTPQPPTDTPTSTPTNTPVPQPSNTPTPKPTVPVNVEPTPTPSPLPGIETIPIADLLPGIPWLSLDPSAVPATYYYGFDLTKPPFDNLLVRQAFALALDRQTLVNIANSHSYKQPRPATTFVPPSVLGRDLYREIGWSFDPGKARELLAQAGYPHGEGFPSVTLVFNTKEGHQAIVDAAITMWRDNLGISVGVESVDDWDTYLDRLATNTPSIYRLAWAADYIDPDNFLNTVFRSSESEYRQLSNAEFNQLVEQAATISDNPEARQALYIQADQILSEQEAAVIPLFYYFVEQ